MKILFLQKVDNARGGIATVNLKLINYFLALHHQVDIVSIRHEDTWESIDYPQDANVYLINEQDVWGCPRLKDILVFWKRGRLIAGVKLLIERFVYKRNIAKDYKVCQKKIVELAPDVIINSHYEVLQGIDEQYLKKTVMHFHTSFDQVLANSSYLKTFQKFKNKIFGFVWLSEKTKKEAMANGFSNSRCIYNPIPFSETRCADMEHKKLVFIGRMSEEKRVHLAIEYFKEIIQEPQFSDWSFEIFGDGELRDSIVAQTKEVPQIVYKGHTDQVRNVLLNSSLMILTSQFEGMPLVVLEANECGVPVIAYNFGETSSEVIIDGRTGVIVPQNDKETFQQIMKELFDDVQTRQKMSVYAKEYAAKFSIGNIGQQWLDLFDEMRN